MFGTVAASGGTPISLMILYVAVLVVVLVAEWRVYVKAGQPGWGCLIPIYNIYLLCKIAGRPGWWLILLFIPIVDIIIGIILCIDIAKNFGHGVGFAIGMIFLSVIFWLILAFGSSEYTAPANA